MGAIHFSGNTFSGNAWPLPEKPLFQAPSPQCLSTASLPADAASGQIIRQEPTTFKQPSSPRQPRFAGGGKSSMEMPGRRAFYTAMAAGTAISTGLTALFPPAGVLFIPLAVLGALGLQDILQNEHSIRKNFPILGRFRYLLESVRPEIQQYFIEKDDDKKPISRAQRETVYQRAKGETDKMPFGTQRNVYAPGYEWLEHSTAPKEAAKEAPRVLIGGSDCKQPYSASIFNISGMSFGALSKNAILALNQGARLGGFFLNTGEGGISPYHMGMDVDIEDKKFDYDALLTEAEKHPESIADLVWQIGTGYFGCRRPDGGFDADKFARRAKLPFVKMLELKLSQGAKPGHGGVLPASKNSPGIAKLRSVEPGTEVLSPPMHKEFSTPKGLLQFIGKLRELSGGKPVGFKLAIGKRHEFLALCKAMLETGITPDFITVDGGEGGTGAAPREFSDSVGMPLSDALLFVHNALNGTGLRDKIKVIASGLVIDGFDVIKRMSMGADLLNSARGMMLALGCIQALRCHTNNCPTGVATQDPTLTKGLVPNDKGPRVANYHKATLAQVLDLTAAAGYENPQEIKPADIQRRLSTTEHQSLDELYEFIPPGSLLDETTVPTSFKKDWERASADSF